MEFDDEDDYLVYMKHKCGTKNVVNTVRSGYSYTMLQTISRAFLNFTKSSSNDIPYGNYDINSALIYLLNEFIFSIQTSY